MKDVQTLPFDQYQRYRLVADLLGELRADGPSLEVLDVGGRTALLRAFLTSDRITLVDVEESQEEGLILGDGARLPFKDGAFDVVCAFDTLEHVPPPLRDAFVRECRRVTRSWVVLAGPYSTPRVVQAEKLLSRFMHDKLGVVHRYLQEHADHGLPVRKRVEAQLEDLGGEVKSFGHANLDRWLVLMCLSLYMDDDPALRKLATSFHRFYNRSLYASDHATPVYRHLVVAAFNGAAMPDAEKHLVAPVAPKGTLQPFEKLSTELLAFDKERGEWRLERDRLRRVVSDLERDLAGSRLSISDLERDLGVAQDQGQSGRFASDEVRETLERDLAGHRERVANLEHELAEVRASVELDRAEERRVLATLKGELEEHRVAMAEVVAQLELGRAESAQQRAALETDLAEHRKSLTDLERELEASGEAALELQAASAEQRATLEADLTEHRRALADVQGELQAVQSTLETSLEEAAAERARCAADLEQGASVRSALEGELEERRRTLTELEASSEAERVEAAAGRAALESVVEEKDRGIANLEGEVRRVEGVAESLNTDLVRALGEVQKLRATVGAREAELVDLRADLADRWRNFLRAISIGKPQG